MAKSYAVGVYGGGTGNDRESPAMDGRRFATEGEAERAGNELLSRWTQPESFIVVETTDPANYAFPAGAFRASRIAS